MVSRHLVLRRFVGYGRQPTCARTRVSLAGVTDRHNGASFSLTGVSTLSEPPPPSPAWQDETDGPQAYHNACEPLGSDAVAAGRFGT